MDTLKKLAEQIKKSSLTEKEKNIILNNIIEAQGKELNILITGGTGSGKSSTINALFGSAVAKVGVGVDPETMEIEKYNLGNVTLWDSPGLGDGKENDIRHSNNIRKKLNEKDKDGNALIDIVLVILDGSSRDYGTSFELINKVIIPNLGKNKERILVAINQSDAAMKGRYWNYEKSCPEKPLENFLDEKAESVKKRIMESTGVEVDPIYYSAGYSDGRKQEKPYNLSKLLYYIISATPTRKRILYADKINEEKKMWESNDGYEDYNRGISSGIVGSITEGAARGAEIGERVGGCFGTAGATVCKVVGGIIGGVAGFIGGLFGF